MNRKILTAIAAGLLAGASPAFALSQYFDQLRFADPTTYDATWSTGSTYTTSTQWESLPAGYASWTLVNPSVAATSNFYTVGEPSAPTAPAAGSLTIGGAINTTPYIFGPGTQTATIHDYGGLTGATVATLTGTHVFVQIAATQGASGTPFAPTGLADAVDNLRLTDAAGQTIAGGDIDDAVITLVDSRPNAANFAFVVDGVSYQPDAQQWLYEFTLPQWTGDFNVVWQNNSHSVFEALRVDTQLVPEPASLGVIALGSTLLMARRRRTVKA